MANVDQASKTAMVQVSQFSTYSLAVVGTFTEANGTSGASATYQLDPAQSSIDLAYLAKNEYPAGIPYSISLPYLKNTASQNTKVNGARVSSPVITSGCPK